tara:strand:+ start:110 stop:676 length:567 start_codon:yes stop_codon:yes gene_type:complete
MSLKEDLIQAKVKAARDAGMVEPLDTKPGSFIERDAHYTTEAIGKFLTECDFTITQLKAPIILEDLRTPEQGVNMQLATLLGDKAPILDTLKKVGGMIPGAGSVINKLVEQLENAIKKAVMPLLEGGATLPGLNLAKDAGGLQSTGYVYIGEDPDSQGAFNVEDVDGQREFTTVKIFKEDIEEKLYGG